MLGFIRGLIGMFRSSKEGELLERLEAYAQAIGVAAVLQEGLADEAVASVREGREINADAVGDVEWNAERQFFLDTLIGRVCVSEGIEEVRMAYAIPAAVLNGTLGMPSDDIPNFIQGCWAQAAIFRDAGEAPVTDESASLRCAYDAALVAAENFLALDPDDQIMPMPEDIANFVTMGPRDANPPVS